MADPNEKTIWEERREREGGAPYREQQRQKSRDEGFEWETRRINAPDYEVPRTGE